MHVIYLASTKNLTIKTIIEANNVSYTTKVYHKNSWPNQANPSLSNSWKLAKLVTTN
jgi:hypothetical protein